MTVVLIGLLFATCIMVLIFKDYHKLNVTQRAIVKSANLQQLLDKHGNFDNANAMRGIICDELATCIAGLKKTITGRYNKKIRDENECLIKISEIFSFKF